MKNLTLLLLPLFLFLLVSCEKEELLQEEPSILSISLAESSSIQEPQEVSVTIEKPTPCHYVSGTNESISGNTFNYDFTLLSGAEVCADVIEEEIVTVTFAPSESGEYTLNFLINGKLYETRTVTVTE
ncbi:hypothetical protein [Nafulsella turpanensis]|uniref:hypothetical protein n=1 Tax=Nafulsella turpanensis TaxID=1265690 RepID=UPI0003476543|nr:hypothetical protein [Nafulsella turpanensis]